MIPATQAYAVRRSQAVKMDKNRPRVLHSVTREDSKMERFSASLELRRPVDLYFADVEVYVLDNLAAHEGDEPLALAGEHHHIIGTSAQQVVYRAEHTPFRID